MSVIDRLYGDEDPKIPIHTFMAVLAEVKRGKVTQAQAKVALSLTDSEATAIAAWFTRMSGDLLSREELHDILILGEAKIYTKQQVINRLTTGTVSGT